MTLQIDVDTVEFLEPTVCDKFTVQLKSGSSTSDLEFTASEVPKTGQVYDIDFNTMVDMGSSLIVELLTDGVFAASGEMDLAGLGPGQSRDISFELFPGGGSGGGGGICSCFAGADPYAIARVLFSVEDDDFEEDYEEDECLFFEASDDEGDSYGFKEDDHNVPAGAKKLEEDEEGEEAWSIKPWIGMAKPPTDANPPSAEAVPEVEPQITWVHGYCCRDAAPNNLVIAGGEIIYHAAALGIAYDPSVHAQRYFVGNDDDITCLAYNEARQLVAFGQLGKNPKVCIFSLDGSLVAEHRPVQKNVTAMAFSDDGSLLAVIGEDTEHTLKVLDTDSGAVRCSRATTPDTIYALAFHGSETVCVTGEKYVGFATASSGWGIKKALLGSKGKRQPFLSVKFTQKGTALVGCKDGSLYAFRGRSLLKANRAHRSSCAGLYVAPDGSFYTGGADGRVVHFASNLRKINEYSIPGGVKAIAHDDGMGLICGCIDGCIRRVEPSECTTLVHGHGRGETWGMAMHPSDPDIYVTVGADKVVYKYSLSQQRAVLVGKLEGGAVSCDISPDGESLAVGLINGRVQILDMNTFSTREVRKVPIPTPKPRILAIRDIKWNPTGDGRLAVAGHNRYVTIFDASGNVEHNFTRHHSTVLHIDWSSDGTMLQTNSTSYELVFFDTESGEQIMDTASTKDQDWATYTLTHAWAVTGIFKDISDYTDINSVCRSHNREMMVLGDDFGQIRVMVHPAAYELMGYVTGAGHSAHVTNAKFSHDDSQIVSIGGRDRTAIVWAI